MPRTLSRDEARGRASLITNLRYQIALDLTGDEHRYDSTVTIDFDCADDSASTFLDLICDAGEVTSVTINDKDRGNGESDGARLQIDGLRKGANTVVVVARPAYEHTGVGLHRFVDPVDQNVYLHTQFESYNARRVFACFDQPDMKGTFAFTVRAPKAWEISSNMTADVTADGDARVWVFAPTPVVSTYITAVVAGPFHIVRDQHRSIGLSLWCRQSLVQYLEADEVFEITKQGFDYFERTFDYPYPFGKYDQLFVPEFNAGAMENAGCVTFSELYIFRSKVTDERRERRAATILHEMAHMWFGDLVTMEWWDDLWLNESFAEYAALVAQVHATRFTNGFVTFANAEKTWAYRQDQLPTTHPIAADCPDVETAELNFDGISYAKGASVLRQLVAWVGEEQFEQGLRNYFRRYEYANADLQGFLEELEKTSGRELSSWAKEWLQTAGVNTLRTDTTVSDDTYSSFAVVQDVPEHYPIHRSHRIAIGLYDVTADGVVRRRREEFDVVGPRTQVPQFAGEKVADLVLVNDDDLTFAKVRFDERSLRTLEQRLRDVRDPLARAQCWTMCWDMVRDAEISASRWRSIVQANIEGETEIGVLRSLLEKVRSAILVYGDPSRRDSAMQEFAAFSLRGLEAAAPGSDRQLIWAQSFITAARSDEHQSLVSGLLAGTKSYNGLAVDTDLRWLIVKSLASAGVTGEAAIAAELKRDPTDAGERHAAAARAGMPAAEAKAEAWRLVVENEALPFATMRAIVGSFGQHEQEVVLQPYVAKYFDAIGSMYASRDLPVAMEFTEDMYPHAIVSEEIATAAEDYLRSDVPGPVRRFVLEGLDGTRRALRGRAKDAQE